MQKIEQHKLLFSWVKKKSGKEGEASPPPPTWEFTDKKRGVSFPIINIFQLLF